MKEQEYLDFVSNLLNGIKEELDRVMWNKNQEEYPNPFDNTGNSFKNDTFEVVAYDWGDDPKPYNFKYKDIEISWYKYLGRGMSINRPVSLTEWFEIYTNCIKSIRKIDD